MTVTSTEVGYPAQDGEDPYSAHLGSTFIPLPVRGMTEQQAIQHSIDHTQHVNLPSTIGSAVNEFTTEGYISCALFSQQVQGILWPLDNVHLPLAIISNT